MSKIIVSATHVHKELAKAAKILKGINDLIEEADIDLTVSMSSLAGGLEAIENSRIAIRNKFIVAAVQKYSTTRVATAFGITPARVYQIAPRKK